MVSSLTPFFDGLFKRRKLPLLHLWIVLTRRKLAFIPLAILTACCGLGFFSKPVSHLCHFVVHTQCLLTSAKLTICGVICYMRTRVVTDRAIEWSNVGLIKSKGIESDLSWRTICPPLAYFTSKTSPRAILIFFWTLWSKIWLSI